MLRDQLPEHSKPTYVLPDHKVVYVAVSKAACTSLKWLVADIQGEDPERFAATLGRTVSRDMCIHDRSGFKRTPMLHELGDSELEAITPENGWFVFTVVRHPAARLFSAWQSKLMLREPKYHTRYGEQPWFPRVPASSDEVVEDFAAFARALAAGEDPRLLEDRHFMVQWRESAAARLPYSRIYDTAEIPQLLSDLAAHLREHGYSGELHLRESNETPLKPIAALFGEEVQAALRSVYADDFEQLGYAETVPPRLDPAGEYSRAALAEVGRLVERHERIGDLLAAAKQLKSELAEARKAARQPPEPPPRRGWLRRG